jgi:hypothetical protein
MNPKLTVEDDLQWKMTLRVQIYPIVVYKGFSILRWNSTKIKEGHEMNIWEHLKLVF